MKKIIVSFFLWSLQWFYLGARLCPTFSISWIMDYGPKPEDGWGHVWVSSNKLLFTIRRKAVSCCKRQDNGRSYQELSYKDVEW